MFKSFFPPHIFQDKTMYFITTRTRDRTDVLLTHTHKQIYWDVFEESLSLFSVPLYGWTINVDHCHFLLYLLKSVDLAKFIQKLHGKSSFLLNKHDKKVGRKIWVNYWDRCIRSERDFFTRLNYIHHNPVKHGYVDKIENYHWSSYQFYQKKYGRDWLTDVFTTYPIIDFSLECPD